MPIYGRQRAQYAAQRDPLYACCPRIRHCSQRGGGDLGIVARVGGSGSDRVFARVTLAEERERQEEDREKRVW